MKNAQRLLPLLALFSLACGLIVPVPPPTPLPATATQTTSPTSTITLTPDIAATQTISVALTELSYTATPTSEFNPEDLVEEEKSIPPPAVSPGAAYQLADEVLIGSYGIRLWRDTNAISSYENILIIEKLGAPSIRIEQASAIAALTGTDINGDVYPEAIIETFSGGAHCCFGTQVYSLGKQSKLILKKPESNAGGQFEDLDGDNIYEFITYDDLFAYQYCPYAGSPFAKAILVYDQHAGQYLPASPRFPQEYAADILGNTATAKNTKPGDYGEWDKTTKCGVLPMVLDYIYMGEPEKGKNELRRVYPYSDVDIFWDEIMLQIQASPLYAPKATE